jgi:hypothetical protein
VRVRLSERYLKSDEAESDALGLRDGRRSFQPSSLLAEARYGAPALAATAFYRLPALALERGESVTTHEVGARVHKTLGESHVGTLGYSFLASDVSRPGIDSEVSGHELTAGVSRILGRLSSAGVAASYAERSIAAGRDGPTVDVTRWSILPSLTWTVRRDLSAALSLGWSELEAQPGEDFSALTAIAALRYRSGRLGAELTLRRGFSESFSEGESFGIVKTSAAEVLLSYRLTPRISLQLTGFYRNNDLLGLGGAAQTQDEQRRGSTTQLRVALTRRLDAALDYGFTRVSSCHCGRGEGYAERRIRVSLTSQFD